MFLWKARQPIEPNLEFLPANRWSAGPAFCVPFSGGGNLGFGLVQCSPAFDFVAALLFPLHIWDLGGGKELPNFWGLTTMVRYRIEERSQSRLVKPSYRGWTSPAKVHFPFGFREFLDLFVQRTNIF